MGNTSSTQFVKEGGRVAAQSFKPCHLFGDSDLYGLGVRLGFYLQYFAAIIAIYFIAVQELRQLRIGLNIIATAIFIALLVNSTQDSLVILDWTILIQLALVFPVYTAPELIVDNYIDRSFLWLLLALFLFVMPWLYFRGINNGRKEGCDVKILFVFAPISIYNSHFVGYLRFCAVVGCIIGVVALMISYANISNAVSKLRKEVENSRKKYFRLYAITICPLLLIITVVLVEMTLKVNHLDMDRSPLESTSQILSFVIGLFISVTVLWHCYVENIKRENESLLEQLLKVGNRIVHGHVHPGPRHERTDDEEQGLVGQTRPEMRQVELQA
ncbi:hypothetical protein M501DRAFT_983190 [Patellaria atrata CBS 101060]|uniref:Uncharacterized protein n=1 Tax=Patellaria atrata CBS 101060 TaxID=1346257 RepID=A0A9P4S2D4_9PEZI|nr:hypothetical protein M501DRAFT_983190 [Patellaria atrata CBS 101060]